MTKKLTVVQRPDGKLGTIKGGRKKAAEAGDKPLTVLPHKGASTVVWWRPGRHWWSLPICRVFQRGDHGTVYSRPLCTLDVLA